MHIYLAKIPPVSLTVGNVDGFNHTLALQINKGVVCMKNFLLVTGLGNPEGKYFQTYHNIGFLCAEKLAERVSADFKKKGNQLICDINVGGKKIFILKPLTYMNLSGQAVAAVSRKYKIGSKNLIVFVDDLYIDKGNIRVSYGGSAAGHNGLKSINEILGTNEYFKIRVGIKQMGNKKSNSDYVLSKIDSDSRIIIEDAIDKAVNAALMIIDGESFSKVQTRFNITNTEE